jgi:hypothetical protein
MNEAQTTQPRKLNAAFALIAAYPWIFMTAVYLEACLVRVSLGRWPVPMTDSPSSLFTQIVGCLASLLAIGLAIAVPVAIALTVASWKDFRRDWRYLVRPTIFALGVFGLVQLVHYDPGRIWTWFMD